MDTIRLRQLMKEKGISIYRLSQMTGIRDGVLGRVVNEKTKDPRISTVSKIADALDVDINELIAKKHEDEKGGNDFHLKTTRKLRKTL